MYSTTYCGYCRRAEELLRRRGVPVETIDVTDDLSARAALVRRAEGRRTVPVIFIDDQLIGGYQELAALAASGELDRRLATAA
jgi:glutaredoxin 3